MTRTPEQDRAKAIEIVGQAIRFSSWAAGERIVPLGGGGVEEPLEFVSEALDALDIDFGRADCPDLLAAKVVELIAAPPVEDLAARVAELEAWKAHIMTHADQKKRPFHDRLAQEVIESQAKTIIRLSADLAGLPGQLAEARARIVELETENTRIRDEIVGLICESDGVTGLHQNGDIAPWSELISGGRFERLSSIDSEGPANG